MAAAANGIGVVGVAPEAQIVAVRVATDDGFFYPPATVCAFMHAASVGIDVTSNRRALFDLDPDPDPNPYPYPTQTPSAVN